MYDVLVTSCPHNINLLKAMNLRIGYDYHSVKGAVSAGRPHQVCLRFKDREKALLFKLKAIS